MAIALSNSEYETLAETKKEDLYRALKRSKELNKTMYEALFGVAQILLITEYSPEYRLSLIESTANIALAKIEGKED